MMIMGSLGIDTSFSLHVVSISTVTNSGSLLTSYHNPIQYWQEHSAVAYCAHEDVSRYFYVLRTCVFAPYCYLMFLNEILRLQELLGMSRAEVLLMARETAGDARIQALYELRPSHLYALLLTLEQIRDMGSVAQVRTCAMMTSI